MKNQQQAYKSSLFALLVLFTLTGLSLSSFSQETVNDPKIVGDSNVIYRAVEQQPTFPGGEKAFGEFLRNNIRYPALARQQNVQGRVFARFVVEKDGKLSDIKILRDPGSGLGDEAMRVLLLSPLWKPGVQSGKVVRVQYIVPIGFTLPGPPPTEMRTIAPTDTSLGKIYAVVQVQPSFAGGQMAYDEFLRKNIVYPSAAKQRNVSGRVFVQFVVETDGSLSDLTILRDPGYGLGAEAIRVLKLSPKWQPGVKNGKSVRTQWTVPVNFSLY